MLFAEKWHTTPFEIMKQDIDDFIAIANKMVKMGKENNTESAKSISHKEERIRVNDKTATGGWF